jgi:hypothetical protein
MDAQATIVVFVEASRGNPSFHPEACDEEREALAQLHAQVRESWAYALYVDEAGDLHTRFGEDVLVRLRGQEVGALAVQRQAAAGALKAVDLEPPEGTPRAIVSFFLDVAGLSTLGLPAVIAWSVEAALAAQPLWFPAVAGTVAHHPRLRPLVRRLGDEGAAISAWARFWLSGGRSRRGIPARYLLVEGREPPLLPAGRDVPEALRRLLRQDVGSGIHSPRSARQMLPLLEAEGAHAGHEEGVALRLDLSRAIPRLGEVQKEVVALLLRGIEREQVTALLAERYCISRRRAQQIVREAVEALRAALS